MGVAKMRMLRWMSGYTTEYKIQNHFIWGDICIALVWGKDDSCLSYVWHMLKRFQVVLN